MKILSILIGLCFVLSFSQKTFACPCSDKANKADKTASSVTTDGKDAATTGESCGEKGHTCERQKDGKACGCEKEKKTKS